MIRAALARRVIGERWKGLAGWTFGLVSLVALQVSVYPTIRDSRKGWSDLTEEFPEALRKIIRMEDYTSPTGYLSMELFSFMIPLIFIGLATSWGARAGAEEDENKTADVLFSLPLSRVSILATRATAMIVVVSATACISIVALTLGTTLVDMDVGVANIAAASVSCGLLGVVFGSTALMASCWTGRRGVGLGAGLGLAITCFVTYSLAPLVGFFDGLLPVNPYQWTIGQNPLAHGMDAVTTSVAVVVAGVFVMCGALLNNRRDIRT